MDNTFDFTVITPTLNAERYILKCLKSIYSQANVSIQHIVVDGGSTDQTLQIIDTFHNTSVLHHSKPGIYNALNHGIQFAEGKIICFLNSDDHYYSPTTLADVLKEFNKKNKIDIYLSGCSFVNLQGETLYSMHPPKDVYSFFSLTRLFICSHPSCFFSSIVFNENVYDTSFKCCSDIEFLIRCIKSSSFTIFVKNKITSCFLLHNSNYSSNKKLQYRDLKNISILHSPLKCFPLTIIILFIYKFLSISYIKFKFKSLFL